MSDPAEQEEASLLWQELLQAKPTAQSSVFSAIRGLKKQMRHDRISHLRSIDLDARFVSLTHRQLGSPPTFANLRCGAWYVPPRICDGTCYFKSTDGHTGNWGFSLSRLNVQVALAAAASGRVLVVDSTRSGKRYPDALSKTLPIWCAVINRALAAELPPDAAWDVALHMPPWVPPSEAAQVEARLAGWVASLRRPALQPLLEQLRQALRAPLRPFWVCPEPGSSHAPPEAPASTPAATYLSVVALCASRVWDAEREREQHSWHYVQGAGDDEENWSRGLKAKQWWVWRERLMAMAAQQPGAG